MLNSSTATDDNTQMRQTYLFKYLIMHEGVKQSINTGDNRDIRIFPESCNQCRELTWINNQNISAAYIHGEHQINRHGKDMI